MINGINNIRLEGIFSGFLQKHLLSFRSGQLPKDIHFTLVFDEKLDDLNLHITRNVSGTTKPKICIFKVNKKLLSDLAEELSMKLFHSLMRPIELQDFLKDKESAGFISFDDLEKSEVLQKMIKSFLEPLQDFTKVKGKRVSVTGDYRNAFNESVPKMLEIQNELFDMIQPLAEHYEKETDSGVIITNDECHIAVRFHGQWYLFKSNYTLFDFISGYTNRRTAYFILCKIEHALEVIVSSESYEQTEIYDKPLRLEAIDQ